MPRIPRACAKAIVAVARIASKAIPEFILQFIMVAVYLLSFLWCSTRSAGESRASKSGWDHRTSGRAGTRLKTLKFYEYRPGQHDSCEACERAPKQPTRLPTVRRGAGLPGH